MGKCSIRGLLTWAGRSAEYLHHSCTQQMVKYGRGQATLTHSPVERGCIGPGTADSLKAFGAEGINLPRSSSMCPRTRTTEEALLATSNTLYAQTSCARTAFEPTSSLAVLAPRKFYLKSFRKTCLRRRQVLASVANVSAVLYGHY